MWNRTDIVIWLLLATILPNRNSAYPCGKPRVCQCLQPLALIQCSSANLTQIPGLSAYELGWMKRIDLRGNHLAGLQPWGSLTNTEAMMYIDGNPMNCAEIPDEWRKRLIGLQCTPASTPLPYINVTESRTMPPTQIYEATLAMSAGNTPGNSPHIHVPIVAFALTLLLSL